MSRIRTIKPEFWTSEQILACVPLARLLFIGIWNFSDDNGIHPASYVTLKAEIFPADDIKITEIKNFVDQLICNKLIEEYSVEEKKYWSVTGWSKHQYIQKPSFKHPLKPKQQEQKYDRSIIPLSYQYDTPIIPLQYGMEWNGMDKKIKKKQEKKKEKKTGSMIPMPEWLPISEWEDFLGMRREKRKAATARSQRALLKKLDGFRTQGYDIKKILVTAVEHCWTGLFAPDYLRAEQKTVIRDTFVKIPDLTTEQRLKSQKALDELKKLKSI